MAATRRTIGLSLAAVALTAVPALAAASWAANGTATGAAQATSMPSGPTPTAPTTGTQTSTSIVVTWPKVQYTGTSTDVAGYVITRYNNGTAEAVSSGCGGTQTGVTCTDTVSASGTYRYSVTPKSGSWTGAEGAKSGTVTVQLPVTLAITDSTYTAAGNGSSGNVKFSGQGASGSSPVSVKVCSTNNFPSCTAVVTVTTNNSPSDPWTTGTSTGNKLDTNGTYYAQATQSGNSSSPSPVFTFTAS